MVRGSRVADPLSVSFFLFFFRFPFCSSSPMCASIARDGIEGFALCASVPFLFFARLSFSLSSVLMRADPAVAGFRLYFLFQRTFHKVAFEELFDFDHGS